MDIENTRAIETNVNEMHGKRKKFVTAWTDIHPHIGNRVSSRAEGAHSKLKGYLQVSTGDFAQVSSKICLAVENEFHEISTTLESERIRVPHRCRIPQFKYLLNRVSHFALGHLYKQYEMGKFGILKEVCSGHFVATMGLPCDHLMSRLKDNELLLSPIDSQWRIDIVNLTPLNGAERMDDNNGISGLCDRLREAPLVEKNEIKEKLASILHASNPLLLEPNIQIPKGRPSGSLNKRKAPASSTRRDSSEFEIVEASLSKRGKAKVGYSSESQTTFEVLDALDSYHRPQLPGVDLISYVPTCYSSSFQML